MTGLRRGNRAAPMDKKRSPSSKGTADARLPRRTARAPPEVPRRGSRRRAAGARPRPGSGAAKGSWRSIVDMAGARESLQAGRMPPRWQARTGWTLLRRVPLFTPTRACGVYYRDGDTGILHLGRDGNARRNRGSQRAATRFARGNAHHFPACGSTPQRPRCGRRPTSSLAVPVFKADDFSPRSPGRMPEADSPGRGYQDLASMRMKETA